MHDQATFDDSMAAEAHAKQHCMTSEALEVGRRARAHWTALTHFSQRYPKVPAASTAYGSSTCIAFDLMTVDLAGMRLNHL